MNPVKSYYDNLAETLIKNFSKRSIEAYYASDSDEALEIASRFLTPGCSVGWGGSATLDEIGLIETLSSSDCTLYDRRTIKSFNEMKELQAKILTADFYFMSSNAVTLDGELVNIDKTGNRVAALCYGPSNVIVVAGMNKVAFSLEAAIERARNIAAPPNCVRLNCNTPCTHTGHCTDCQSDDCLCSHIVITRHSFPKGRIKVILVGESLGF